MKKVLSILILSGIFLFPACRTSQDESINQNEKQMAEISSIMFDLTPEGKKLFFFTITARQHIRDKELKICREEASRQLSRYFQINGVSYSRTNESAGGTAKKEATGIAFNNDRAISLVEDLELEEQIQTEDLTAALFSYSKTASFSLPYKPALKEDEPDWIYSSVKIPGYQVAVGFTGPSRFLSRTLQQADKNALATLLEQRNGSMDITQSDWQTQTASSSRTSMVETAAGSIIPGLYPFPVD